jgi:hypothetical protein
MRLNDFTSILIIFILVTTYVYSDDLLSIRWHRINSQEIKRRTEESPIRAQLKTPTEIVVFEQSDMQASKSI